MRNYRITATIKLEPGFREEEEFESIDVIKNEYDVATFRVVTEIQSYDAIGAVSAFNTGYRYCIAECIDIGCVPAEQKAGER